MFSNDPVTKSKEEAAIPSCCCTHTVPAFYYARGRARTPHSAEMAARIGWNTVYSTLQLSRLRRLFEQRQKGPEDNDRGTFDDWNKCRIEDGILCRDSEDCVWIDSNLYCDESGLNFTPEVSGTVSGHKGGPTLESNIWMLGARWLISNYSWPFVLLSPSGSAATPRASPARANVPASQPSTTPKTRCRARRPSCRLSPSRSFQRSRSS